MKTNQATQKERQGEELHINQEFLDKYFHNAYLVFNKQMPFLTSPFCEFFVFSIVNLFVLSSL